VVDVVITQLSFLPDNDQPEPKVRGSVPLLKFIDGHWYWLIPGTVDYAPEPELERMLLAALARMNERKAA
jgi:hypothetical protein